MTTMQVETFEVSETTDQGPEFNEEQIKLVRDLELTGQESLISIDDDSNLTTCPYRKIRKDESDVYQTLCPKHTKVEDFSEHMIPLRVLQVIAHAESLEYFDKGLYVWHPDGEVKDPILLGQRSRDGSNWEVDRFLLARWGEELLPFEKLCTKAGKILKLKRVDRLKEIQLTIDQEIKSIQALSPESCLSKGVEMPSFYKK